MMPFVYLNGTPISMYFLMGVSGFLFAVFIALVKRKTFGLRVRDTLRIAVVGMVGAVIGARILGLFVQILLHGKELGFLTAENLLGIFRRSSGILYGGLFGCMVMVALGAKFCRVDIRSAFNVLAYAAPAFDCVMRLGCWCSGCCHGITLADGTRFPSQLFEAGFCALLLLAFLIAKPEHRWPGVPLLPINLIAYSAGRFILEFFRGDASRGVWLLSTSQWISLLVFPIAVVLLVRTKKAAQQK